MRFRSHYFVAFACWAFVMEDGRLSGRTTVTEIEDPSGVAVSGVLLPGISSRRTYFVSYTPRP